MAVHEIACVRCEYKHPPSLSVLACGNCGAPVEVIYPAWTPDIPGVQPPNWNGAPVPLPIMKPESYIYLGEGNTPVIDIPNVARAVGLRDANAKLEFMNPTGSFKDRGTAIMISMVKELGGSTVVEDSSGNAGASVSAYSARAGLLAHVFAPSTAPQPKIQQIKVYGADVHSITGTRDETTDAAERYHTSNGLVYASHNRSPYFIEGTKTFAYEIFAQFRDNMPAHIVIPVGNGSLYIGARKGFGELRSSGFEFALPKLHAIQAEAVSPVAAKFNGLEWEPSKTAYTVAGGISVGNPPHLSQIVDIARNSGGSVVAVADESIIEWQLRLAETEGIYAEPTSAAAFAGLQLLGSSGAIRPDEKVLVAVTGFGLKDKPPVG